MKYNAQTPQFDILIFQGDPPYGFWTTFHYICSEEVTSIDLDKTINSSDIDMMMVTLKYVVIILSYI